MDENQTVQYTMDPNVAIAIACICIAVFVLILVCLLLAADKKR